MFWCHVKIRIANLWLRYRVFPRYVLSVTSVFIITQHCCLIFCCLTELHGQHCHFISVFLCSEDMIIYGFIYAWAVLFFLSPDMFILFLMFVCEWCLTNLSISLCLLKEKVNVSLTTAPEWKFVTFVPVEQLLNRGPPYFNSTHLCSIDSSLSLPVNKKTQWHCHSWAEKCVRACVLKCVTVSECFWAEVRGSRLHFLSHPLRRTSLLDWVRRFSL